MTDSTSTKAAKAVADAIMQPHPVGTKVEDIVAPVIAAEIEPVMELLREALKTADKEASIVHDAIWAQEVKSAGILHDDERPDSAQSAICRLHEAVRPALEAARIAAPVEKSDG